MRSLKKLCIWDVIINTIVQDRLLKIPQIIAEEIEKRRKFRETNKQKYGEQYYDHDYISCQEKGVPHTISSMNNALTKLCSRNGLPHITVHGLRHMYATILIEQGVPLIKISALLGHACLFSLCCCKESNFEKSSRRSKPTKREANTERKCFEN